MADNNEIPRGEYGFPWKKKRPDNMKHSDEL